MADGFVDTIRHLIHGQVRNGPVQGRGADKGVNTRFRGQLHRLKTAINVRQLRTRQPTDHRVF